MPQKYLSERAVEMVEEVQRHMKATVMVDIDLSTAVSFMYRVWRDRIIDEATGRGEERPELKEFS